MKQKAKLGITPAGICTLVFSILGVVFLLIGILCTCFPEDSDDKTVGIVFAILGNVFLVVALISLLILIREQRQKQKALSGGKYIYGEVVDIVPNAYIHYGYRSPFTVLTRYIDQNGVIHIFRSQNLRSYPDRSILGRKVKIYYTDESFHQYYVDLQSGLPRVIEH